MSGTRGMKHTANMTDFYLSSFKSDLASISSASENDFVHNKFGRVWIGGKRECSSCKSFVWTDGTPWSYSNWHSGEPNDWVASNYSFTVCHRYRLGWKRRSCSNIWTWEMER